MPQTSPPLYMHLEEGVAGAMRRVPRLVRYVQLRGGSVVIGALGAPPPLQNAKVWVVPIRS